MVGEMPRVAFAVRHLSNFKCTSIGGSFKFNVKLVSASTVLEDGSIHIIDIIESIAPSHPSIKCVRAPSPRAKPLRIPQSSRRLRR